MLGCLINATQNRIRERTRRKKWSSDTKAPEGPQVPVTKKKYAVVLLFVRIISEQYLMRVFRSFNISAYFKPTNTLWQLLVWPKDKVETVKVVGLAHYV